MNACQPRIHGNANEGPNFFKGAETRFWQASAQWVNPCNRHCQRIFPSSTVHFNRSRELALFGCLSLMFRGLLAVRTFRSCNNCTHACVQILGLGFQYVQHLKCFLKDRRASNMRGSNFNKISTCMKHAGVLKKLNNICMTLPLNLVFSGQNVQDHLLVY